MPMSSFARELRRYYALYTGGFVLFVLLLALGEHFGLSERVISHVFLFVTIAIYAAIGVISRTSDVAEYYVAGRRVPAVFNGMATAADWMSAASFIGLAGTLYFAGFEGLAFVTGWTGYKAAVRALALGSASDPALGNPRFVSSQRISPGLNQLSWFSTVEYLSIIVLDFRPERIVVDPAGNYFWLSCKTATNNAKAARSVPESARELVRIYSCLHRR